MMVIMIIIKTFHPEAPCCGVLAVGIKQLIRFSCPGYSCYESRTLTPRSQQDQDCATLARAGSTMVALRSRTWLPAIARTEAETHRFSINGHFYNHEVQMLAAIT